MEKLRFNWHQDSSSWPVLSLVHACVHVCAHGGILAAVCARLCLGCDAELPPQGGEVWDCLWGPSMPFLWVVGMLGVNLGVSQPHQPLGP
jgi:hypothetical protein